MKAERLYMANRAADRAALQVHRFVVKRDELV